jgi:hypothetical protein
MNLTTATTLVLLALAAGLAWYLGGREGTGVISGFLAGAAISGLSLELQRRVARERPQFLVHAVFAGFLLKACAVLGLTLTVALVPPLAAICDPVAFLVAFAAAALAILTPATLDTLRLVTPARAPAAPAATNPIGLEGRTL